MSTWDIIFRTWRNELDQYKEVQVCALRDLAVMGSVEVVAVSFGDWKRS